MKLNPGDVICYKCKGERLISSGIFTEACPNCHADGKVDWIENIVGKSQVDQHEIDCKLIEILMRRYETKT